MSLGAEMLGDSQPREYRGGRPPCLMSILVAADLKSMPVSITSLHGRLTSVKDCVLDGENWNIARWAGVQLC